jgi:hypothetical protein
VFPFSLSICRHPGVLRLNALLSDPWNLATFPNRRPSLAYLANSDEEERNKEYREERRREHPAQYPRPD